MKYSFDLKKYDLTKAEDCRVFIKTVRLGKTDKAIKSFSLPSGEIIKTKDMTDIQAINFANQLYCMLTRYK